MRIWNCFVGIFLGIILGVSLVYVFSLSGKDEGVGGFIKMGESER